MDEALEKILEWKKQYAFSLFDTYGDGNKFLGRTLEGEFHVIAGSNAEILLTTTDAALAVKTYNNLK